MYLASTTTAYHMADGTKRPNFKKVLFALISHIYRQAMGDGQVVNIPTNAQFPWRGKYLEVIYMSDIPVMGRPI